MLRDVSDRRLGSELTGEIERCLDALSVGRSTASSELLLPMVERFAAFLVATSCASSLREVSPSDCVRFLCSRTSFGLPAKLSTVHNRRNAVRALYTVARSLGLADGDPTLDVRLAAKDSVVARPLTDAEVNSARAVSAGWGSLRYRFVWALAETTARGSELARVAWSDVDLVSGTVSLPGSSRVRARVGPFTEWGLHMMRDHGDRTGLVAVGDGSSARVQAASGLSQVFFRAGIAGRSGVRPGSVAAWAGRRVLDETGDISAVARVLGVSSLDVAARMVGWQWQTS